MIRRNRLFELGQFGGYIFHAFWNFNLLGAFIQTFAAFRAEFRRLFIGNQAFVVELDKTILEILLRPVNPDVVQQQQIGGDIHLAGTGLAVAAAGAV